MLNGKASKINSAQAHEPKSGHEAPAGKFHNPVGNESKANVKGAQNGKPTDGNPLRAAGNELRSQHPHAHNSHGPHHNDKSHVRHVALHGMKAKG